MISEIRVPQKIDLETSIEFAKKLKETVPSESFVFDFSRVSRVRPFGMLRMACAIREFMTRNHHSSEFTMRHNPVNTYNQNAVGYAGHMGFFRACGLEFGNLPGGTPGNSYIPLTFRKVKDLVAGKQDRGSRMEEIAYQLAGQLVPREFRQTFLPCRLFIPRDCPKCNRTQ